jgi:hypothetical protein
MCFDFLNLFFVFLKKKLLNQAGAEVAVEGAAMVVARFCKPSVL